MNDPNFGDSKHSIYKLLFRDIKPSTSPLGSIYVKRITECGQACTLLHACETFTVLVYLNDTRTIDCGLYDTNHGALVSSPLHNYYTLI